MWLAVWFTHAHSKNTEQYIQYAVKLLYVQHPSPCYLELAAGEFWTLWDWQVYMVAMAKIVCVCVCDASAVVGRMNILNEPI